MTASTSNEQFKTSAEKLDSIAAQLKREYFGIDDIIDGIIENMRAWCAFPEMQERPLIISLWGLTGVGKTSLVKRLVQLLDRERDLVYYNFAAIDDMDLDSVTDHLATFVDRLKPDKIFVFDEFQYAATLDGNGEEKKNKSGLKAFWELMDTGILHSSFSLELLSNLQDYIAAFNVIRTYGTPIVVDGVWVNRNEFASRMTAAELRYASCYYALPNIKGGVSDEDDEWTDTDASGMFNTRTYTFSNLLEVDSELCGKRIPSAFATQDYANLTSEQVYAKLTDMYKRAARGFDTDYHQSIIFVLGNLDEAYEMTFNVDPDMSPDQFHKASQEINIVQIKQALQRRFRNEQIARLGNIHLIYPSFSSETFMDIISHELGRYATQVKDKFDLELTFDDSIKKLIYNDAVFPTHGARPIFSTIYEIVKSQLPRIKLHICELGTNVSRVVFGARGTKTILTYLDADGQVVDKTSADTQLRIENLRNGDNDEQQALVSVHESGHFITYLAMYDKIPARVCSRAVDKSTAGFVLKTFDPEDLDMMTALDIKKEICTCVAGQIAERMIFGEDHTSNGAYSDLNTATALASAFVRRYGLGGYPYVISYQRDSMEANGGLVVNNPDIEGDVNAKIATLISDAQNVVTELLSKPPVMQALQKSAKYLAKHATLPKKFMAAIHKDIKPYMNQSILRSDRFYRDIVEKF